MTAGQCNPKAVPSLTERLISDFQDGHAGAHILRIDHQTAMLLDGEILLTLLIHFRI